MDAHDLRVWTSFLLAGSWVNTALFTLEVVLCVFYMQRWQLSRVYTWGFVLVLVNDTLGTVCVCANLFLFLVNQTDKTMWPVPVLLISTALSALIEQTFLVHRYWKVTQNTIISVFIMLVSVTHMALSIAAVCLSAPDGGYPVWAGLSVSNLPRIAAIICAAADVLIALSMVWSMSGIDPMWPSTQHLIRSVCINALTSGAVVATVTLLAMITLIVKDINSIVFSLFFATMGRVYSLTIVVNFIHRSQRSAANSLHITEHVQSHSHAHSHSMSIIVGDFFHPALPPSTRNSAHFRSNDSDSALGNTSEAPRLHFKDEPSGPSRSSF
ncbi:hypothetical protein DFH09DRAFT_1434175 [Mycena vulgaris]|nr:hypothetical protein DFH09DRAFT_1434175 [Mycena vulgaris]